MSKKKVSNQVCSCSKDPIVHKLFWTSKGQKYLPSTLNLFQTSLVTFWSNDGPLRVASTIEGMSSVWHGLYSCSLHRLCMYIRAPGIAAPLRIDPDQGHVEGMNWTQSQPHTPLHRSIQMQSTLQGGIWKIDPVNNTTHELQMMLLGSNLFDLKAALARS